MSLLRVSRAEPPKEVIDFVAMNAIRATLPLAAGTKLREAIAGRCGYVGEWAPVDYLNKLVEFNRSKLPPQIDLDTSLSSSVELDMPACITARAREVDVHDNQGIGQLIKAELGMDYDPVDRRWAIRPAFRGDTRGNDEMIASLMGVTELVRSRCKCASNLSAF